jgi:hypothetical protein
MYESVGWDFEALVIHLEFGPPSQPITTTQKGSSKDTTNTNNPIVTSIPKN